MDSFPEVADLRLVLAIEKHGSVGAAARELLVSQPSASQRLSVLERRCGARLFERNTTGARPTPAGAEMVSQARHILGHLEGVFERTRGAGQAETMSVGTISSLAMLVFPSLHTALPHIRISQVTDHGPRLIDWIAEGSLDAAFLAIAGQMVLPSSVTHQVFGTDTIAVLLPHGCELSSARRGQLSGRAVVTYTTDRSGEELDRRLIALGATPHRMATAETAVRMGRLLGEPVVLPRSLLRAYRADGETELPAPGFGGPRLSLVSRLPIDPRWHAALPMVRQQMGLSPSRRRGRGD